MIKVHYFSSINGHGYGLDFIPGANYTRLRTPSVPKKQVTLEFKNCLKKQVILPYLESACACKNQLVPNMDSK
jgi:hypothetical protein